MSVYRPLAISPDDAIQMEELVSKIIERVGIALSTALPAKVFIDVGRRSEALGFDSVWLAEVYHFRSATSLAVAVGDTTTKIDIALGIIPTHSRHPALIAMEAATLDELNAGRHIMGLGAATRIATHHNTRVSLVTQMREAIIIIRAMMEHGEVELDGEAFQVKPTHLEAEIRRGIPILLGTYSSSTKMLQIAGELGNGYVDFCATPALIRQAREIMGEAAIKAGRDPSKLEVGSYFFISVDDNACAARAAVKRTIAGYAPIVHRVWRHVGLADAEDIDPVLEAIKSGGLDAGEQAVSDAGWSTRSRSPAARAIAAIGLRNMPAAACDLRLPMACLGLKRRPRWMMWPALCFRLRDGKWLVLGCRLDRSWPSVRLTLGKVGFPANVACFAPPWRPFSTTSDTALIQGLPFHFFLSQPTKDLPMVLRLCRSRGSSPDIRIAECKYATGD